MKRLLPALLALGLLGGCSITSAPEEKGSSRPDGAAARAPEKPRLTRRQFIRRANDNCIRTSKSAKRLLRREKQAIASGQRTGSTAQLEADVLKKLFRILRSDQRKLVRLRPPESSQAPWDLYRRSIKRALALVDPIVKATRTGDRAKARRLTKRSDRLGRPGIIALRQIGIRRCEFSEKSFGG